MLEYYISVTKGSIAQHIDESNRKEKNQYECGGRMRGIRLFLAILLAGILTQNIFVEAAESNGIDAVQLHGMTLHTTQLDLTGLSAAGKGWGMGPERDALNRPLTAKQYQSAYSQLGVDFLVPTEEKTIYLTYDAGVEAGYTNRVLDILKSACQRYFFAWGLM